MVNHDNKGECAVYPEWVQMGRDNGRKDVKHNSCDLNRSESGNDAGCEWAKLTSMVGLGGRKQASFCHLNQWVPMSFGNFLITDMAKPYPPTSFAKDQKAVSTTVSKSALLGTRNLGLLGVGQVSCSHVCSPVLIGTVRMIMVSIEHVS
eukprot:6033165-Amphidinium_carterae.1